MTGSNLLFLVSLPRAGSTLLQRILTVHSSIATADEPWLLLPWIYALRSKGIQTEYGHATWLRALRGLRKRVPDVEQRIYDHLRRLLLDVYTELAGGSPYFLDKTPRYHLITREIAALFPEARFIILLRSPVSIYASSLAAFRGGSLRRMDHLDVDLLDGPGNIAAAASYLGDRCVTIRYEDLVSNPSSSVRKVCSYLSLEFEESMIRDFSTKRPEGLGDHSGIEQSKGIENHRDKWRDLMDSPVRKLRLRRYLRVVDDRYLSLGDYDRSVLLDAIDTLPLRALRPQEWVWWGEEVFIRWAKNVMGRGLG